ncbi:hypothetical protein [Microvirga lotononidis]|uniref:Uncharacterized protein n=1 Tax=Microvirga lotononidis TaxID=864069 RepID=I4YP20_9HYPH|nr:hypothetical protein [Microvirga lotononidis]EIM25712.1 hypothetical protein MicloDRAFT_00064390 [Microvirga lotononidis]WQO25648.1 hypothetical protein U0023_13070 [Microvirga lotononidis]
MPRITELLSMEGETLATWRDIAPGWDSRLAIWAQARNEIADMINAPLHLIEEIEDEDGEFFGFDGEKLGYLVHRFEPYPSVSRPPVVDLGRFFQQAAE